jgi:aminobenzoyl-glutamate utilization protein B
MTCLLSRCQFAAVCVLSLLSVTNSAWADKQSAINTVNAREQIDWDASQKIWGWAEPGYQESRSSELLASLLKNEKFVIQTGVAEIPTAFTATYGSGSPVIGILGEFDALPGLTQTAVPYRDKRDDKNGYGHGCGHHLFGVASASAAIAIARQIDAGEIQGTVRFYGCPAEEGGSAKVFMVRAGLFKDCDAVLHWHPSNRNAAGGRSSLARIAARFRFHGKSAHAAGAPEQGRSSLDAVELTNHAAQLLREHTPDFTRIHHVITAGGGAPNVVPDFAEVYYYIRHPNSTVLKPLYQRLELCAKAGGLATETRLEIDYQGGIREILPNRTLSDVVAANLRELNDLEFTNDEIKFALKLQSTMSQPKPLDDIKRVENLDGTVGKGSTDVGDVSWVVPTTGFNTACWVPGTPGHSWQAVACGGTGIARKGMNLAARVLTATAWDLFTSQPILTAAADEHKKRRDGRPYVSLLLPGQAPPLNYRKDPVAP